MGNYLRMTTQHQVETLLELGWAHRRIARELGVHRETVGRYARLREAKPANVIAGSGSSDEDPGGGRADTAGLPTSDPGARPHPPPQ